MFHRRVFLRTSRQLSMKNLIPYYLYWSFFSLSTDTHAATSFSRCYNVPILNNKLTETGSLGILSNTSRIRCLERCVHQRQCLAFFYVGNIRLCQLHKNYLPNEDVTYEEKSGAKYYAVAGFEHCHSAGYVVVKDQHFCYKIYAPADSTWIEGNSTCASDGGNLIVIRDETHFDFITAKLKSNTIHATMNAYYIDGTKRKPGDEFRTHDNKGLPWIEWGPDQPNNLAGKQDCMEISRQFDWRMNDYGCHERKGRGFICEMVL